MSIVGDRVRRLDAKLDRIPFAHTSTAGDTTEAAATLSKQLSSPKVSELQRLVKTLSAASASQNVMSRRKLLDLITSSKLVVADQADGQSQFEANLQWLFISKATVQVYGIVMNTLLDQIMPLSDHIWYWDDVVTSPAYCGLYMVQMAPAHLIAWIYEVYRDSKVRFQQTIRNKDDSATQQSSTATPSLGQRWRQFYNIVGETVQEKSLTNVQLRLMSPVARCRSEARQKQAALRLMREKTSSGLGILIEDALSFRLEGNGDASDESAKDVITPEGAEWKTMIARSVALMDLVVNDIQKHELKIPDFEASVLNGVSEDPELSSAYVTIEEHQPTAIQKKLERILETQLGDQKTAMKCFVAQNGQPSRLVRYWLPATALLFSSTTILKVLVKRKQDILNWVADFGGTLRDFWFNWVIEPTRKVVGTIRHDSNSEIAIMSRDSLKADRDSLERMVVDFAVDKPSVAADSASLSESQIAEIRARVKEGDVTPILRAYERDIRSPFVGTIRGDLVRTLLIQVQKTKVDVEVAIAGIDALLRSQELVFGFIGLTPGIIVSISIFQYLRGVFGGRKGFRQERKSGQCLQVLRNIDRLITQAAKSTTATSEKRCELSYKDHGLLICEIHILRQLAHDLLSANVEREFLEDLDDLAHTRGISTQMRALDRIRWAYAKWLR